MQNSRTWSNGPCLIFGTQIHPTALPERRGRRSAASARDVRIRARNDLPERPPGRTARDGQVCTHTHLRVRYLVLLVLNTAPARVPDHASLLRELLSLLDACAALGSGLSRLQRLCGDAQWLRRQRRVVGGCARGPCRPGEAAAFPAPSLSGSTSCRYGRGPRTDDQN